MTQEAKFLAWLGDAWPTDEFVYCDQQRALVNRAAILGMVARGYRPIGDVHYCVRLNYRLGESLNEH